MASHSSVRHHHISELPIKLRSPSISEVQSGSDEEIPDDEVFNCNCIVEHNKFSNWNRTIGLAAELLVSQGNPLVIGKPSYLFVCPFKFRLRAKLVRHKYKRAEKDFKIFVGCGKANEDYDLPASTFRYAFILKNHNENGVNKQYGGVWYYPKSKKLYKRLITYSKLIKPGRGWINEDSVVTVEIELTKVA